MKPSSKAKPEVFLHPGEFYFGGSSDRIGTLLGSCVAICLWHPILRIGGMCHFVLPANQASASTKLNGRYATDALQLFKREVSLRKTTMKEYQGLIFGGGNVVAALANSEQDTIGTRNAGIAMDLLQKEKVAIMVVDVGETWSRRISFNVSTGEVMVKRQGQTFITR
jgi:chemotaxis protein CheD